jgi:hypothetical protein
MTNNLFLTTEVGAQVMLIKVLTFLYRQVFDPNFVPQNLVQGELVNGSVGRVIAFSTSKEALKNHTEIARTDNVRGESARSNDWSNPCDPVIQSDRVWPVVRFTNGRTMLCVPAEFTVNNAQGEMEARRDQVLLEYLFHRIIQLNDV